MKTEYIKYLCSKRWSDERLRAIEVYGEVCSACGDTHGIQFHHAYYPPNIWMTETKHLMPLCDRCHSMVHTLDVRPFTHNETLIESKKLEVIECLRRNGRVTTFSCVNRCGDVRKHVNALRQAHAMFLARERRKHRSRNR